MKKFTVSTRYIGVALLAFSLFVSVVLFAELVRSKREVASLLESQEAVKRELNRERARRLGGERDLNRSLGGTRAIGEGVPLSQMDAASAVATYDQTKATAERFIGDGNLEEAFRLYKWCYLNASLKNPKEKAILRNLLSQLGQKHPEARQVLTDIRDSVEDRIIASGDDVGAIQEFATLNSALKEKEKTLALWDALPATSGSRKVIGPLVFEQLMLSGRFSEAAGAKTFAAMIGEVENWGRMADGFPQSSARGETQSQMAQNLVALAASGKLAEAQFLANRMIELDRSPGMRVAVKEAFVKAGQPGLVR